MTWEDLFSQSALVTMTRSYNHACNWFKLVSGCTAGLSALSPLPLSCPDLSLDGDHPPISTLMHTPSLPTARCYINTSCSFTPAQIAEIINTTAQWSSLCQNQFNPVALTGNGFAAINSIIGHCFLTFISAMQASNRKFSVSGQRKLENQAFIRGERLG